MMVTYVVTSCQRWEHFFSSFKVLIQIIMAPINLWLESIIISATFQGRGPCKFLLINHKLKNLPISNPAQINNNLLIIN